MLPRCLPFSNAWNILECECTYDSCYEPNYLHVHGTHTLSIVFKFPKNAPLPHLLEILLYKLCVFLSTLISSVCPFVSKRGILQKLNANVYSCMVCPGQCLCWECLSVCLREGHFGKLKEQMVLKNGKSSWLFILSIRCHLCCEWDGWHSNEGVCIIMKAVMHEELVRWTCWLCVYVCVRVLVNV